jgi:hypothetical protein
MQDSEMRRRLKKAKEKELFCCTGCYFEYKRVKKYSRNAEAILSHPMKSLA